MSEPRLDPPQVDYCCPHCGADAEGMGEAEVAGLPAHWTVYLCPDCGQLVADEGLVRADDYWRERAADERADGDDRRREP